MKLKLLSLFLTLFAFSFKSKAQLTADFPDSNYYWNERHAYYYEDLNIEVSDEGIIYDKGDSLYQGKLYRKLFYKVLFRNDWYPPAFRYKRDTILIGLIRNDKINKRVYFVKFYQSQDSTEQLLFDFGLNVGDRYPRNFQNITSPGMPGVITDSVVVKIDTVIDPYGIKRAVFILDTNYIGTSPIIQGIGCLMGFLINTLYLPFEHSNDAMNCIHFENGKSLSFYLPSNAYIDSSNCLPYQYSFVSTKISTPINIYPNPTTSEISIIIPEEEATFTLINTLGQSIELKGIRENAQWKFNVSIYPTGIYYIRINTIDNNYYFSSFAKL